MRRRPDPGWVCGIAAFVLVAAACGKRGSPLPPLRPVPEAVTALSAEVDNGRVTLRWTLPDQNIDGTTPSGAERVEIYRLAAAPTDPATPATEIVQPANLRASIALRRPVDGDRTPAAVTSSQVQAGPPAAAPGEPATFSEAVPAIAAGPGEWRYVVQAVAGRGRRGPASPVLTVPLGAAPPAPAGLVVAYDERDLRLTWTQAAPSLSYLVNDVTAAREVPLVLTAAPIAEPAFTQPVTFGERRCFAVRAVQVTGAVSVTGPLSAPACETPLDRFAPPAPERLVATIDGDVVALGWSAVPAADLAGYVVLRGEGLGETLQPLTAGPVTATTYRDTTAEAGVAYTYAVLAIDRSDNRSALSNRQAIRRESQKWEDRSGK